MKHPLARELESSALSSSSPSFSSSSSKKPAGKIRATPLIELNHVTIRLGGRRILNDVTWTMRRGENWALLGPNGSGKTTLLSLIQGDNPQAYALDLRLFGVRPESTATLWDLRRKIGWFSPELHLHYPAGWSCLEVVCSGFFNQIGLYEPCTSRQRAAARGWLRRLGLAHRAEQSFGELSLGDQRLVLLARAVVKNRSCWFWTNRARDWTSRIGDYCWPPWTGSSGKPAPVSSLSRIMRGKCQFASARFWS